MTSPIVLTDLVKGLGAPKASLISGSAKSGVSMADLLSQGVNPEWIELQLSVGKKLVELPELWSDLVRKSNARAMQAPAVAEPTAEQLAAKAAREATKQTFSVPYQSKAIPENETPEQELARLRSENVKLKTAKTTANRLTFKVSEKGAISVYGMGKWPVTLYREQWERLTADETVLSLQDFIAANASQLSTKE